MRHCLVRSEILIWHSSQLTCYNDIIKKIITYLYLFDQVSICQHDFSMIFQFIGWYFMIFMVFHISAWYFSEHISQRCSLPWEFYPTESPRNPTEIDLSEMRVDFPDADQSCGWDSEDMGFMGSIGWDGTGGMMGPGWGAHFFQWYPLVSPN